MIIIFNFSKSGSASSGQLRNGKYILNFTDVKGLKYFTDICCVKRTPCCCFSVLALISTLILTFTMEVTVIATNLHTISRTKRHSTPRWTIPCGPGHVAIARSTTRKSVEIEGVIMEQLETINRKATETKEKVAHLEELYVST